VDIARSFLDELAQLSSSAAELLRRDQIFRDRASVLQSPGAPLSVPNITSERYPLLSGRAFPDRRFPVTCAQGRTNGACASRSRARLTTVVPRVRDVKTLSTCDNADRPCAPLEESSTPTKGRASAVHLGRGRKPSGAEPTLKAIASEKPKARDRRRGARSGRRGDSSRKPVDPGDRGARRSRRARARALVRPARRRGGAVTRSLSAPASECP